MLLSHMFGASLVEALVTSLVFAYIQKSYPYFLTSLRTIVSGGKVAEGEAVHIPLWQIFAGSFVAVTIILFIAGLITGGGSIGHLFGEDWSQVNWADVAVMLLITGILALILVPLAWFLLPPSIKRVGTYFTALAIIVPLGLIAPGFAFGEGKPDDVKAAFGYIPEGLKQLSGFFSAPFDGYNVPIPFFNANDAPIWHAALGYEISGIIGILLTACLKQGKAGLWGVRVDSSSAGGSAVR
jgi:cobalt/nickel transport protein